MTIEVLDRRYSTLHLLADIRRYGVRLADLNNHIMYIYYI